MINFEQLKQKTKKNRLYNQQSFMIYIRLEGPEDRHLRNSSFGGHVTSLTLQYLWPRPPWGLTRRAWLQAGAQ